MVDSGHNKELSHYRYEVHRYLDVLWYMSNKKYQARTTWYNWLALQLGKRKTDTHVSKFSLDDCKQALTILKRKYKQLTGKNNLPKSYKGLNYRKRGNKNNEFKKSIMVNKKD